MKNSSSAGSVSKTAASARVPAAAAARAPVAAARAPAESLAVLYRIGSIVNSTEDPVEALRLILAEVSRVLGASSATIALLNPNNGKLCIEVAHGHGAGVVGWEIAPGQGVTGWVAMHGVPLLVPDVRRDPRYFQLREGVRSELAAPLEMLGQVVGVVNCDSDRIAAFNDDDRSLLSLLTNEAAKVVGRLWLLRQLKAKAAQLEAIIAAAQALARERAMPRILSDLAAHTRQLVGAKAVAVYLAETDSEKNPAAAMLRLARLDGSLGASRLAEAVRCADTALGVTITRSRQVEVPRAGRHEEFLFAKLDTALADSSLFATPIVFDGEPLGALLVIQGAPHRFSDETRRLLSTIAAIGASAMQNARLYARVFDSEENLRRGERLGTLGLLAAEIAHEIRNPLTVIKLLFDTLDLRFPAGDARAEDVQVIREKLSHLEQIVTRVLEYGRSRAVTFEVIHLGAVVAQTLLLMRLKIEQSRVRVIFENVAGDAADIVSADKGQVQQVLVNLLFNALNAMPDGGEIHLKLTRESDGVMLRVADTGTGVPDALRDKVFASFLTGRKEGTGLGLAVAKRIMRAHHGDILLENTSPAGTTFLLRFPAQPALTTKDTKPHETPTV
jgi:signal transduction histidine kinase